MIEGLVGFPNLGIEFEHLSGSIRLFDTLTISYFGIFLGVSLLIGFFITEFQAWRSGQDTELYLDLAIYVVVAALLGARIFYILLGGRSEDLTILARLMNFDNGRGMTFFGGLIAGVVTAFVYCFFKKQSFFKVIDTCAAGVCAGQIVGRVSDFFSIRNYGGYTDNLFAMRIPAENIPESLMSDKMIEAARVGGYVGYVQVHPLFLYEMAVNIILLILILILYGKFRRDGDLFVAYVGLYSLARTFLDGLVLGDVSAPQMTAVLLCIGAVIYFFVRKLRESKLI